MLVIAVESSTIASVGYDPAPRLLQLEFRSRTIYHYFSVPAAVHAALLDAPSKGRYFNQTIRGRFRYRLVSVVHSDALDAPLPSGLGR
jgi:hypothetical protein